MGSPRRAASVGSGAVGEDASHDGGEGLELLERLVPQLRQQRLGPGWGGGAQGSLAGAAGCLLGGEGGQRAQGLGVPLSQAQGRGSAASLTCTTPSSRSSVASSCGRRWALKISEPSRSR